eukprot:2363482-Lingulodinium_polyedra.AAC.1
MVAQKAKLRQGFAKWLDVSLCRGAGAAHAICKPRRPARLQAKVGGKLTVDPTEVLNEKAKQWAGYWTVDEQKHQQVLAAVQAIPVGEG